MAVLSPRSHSVNTRSVDKSYRRQALIWLVVTLLLGVVTALVWMFSKTPAAKSQIENAPITMNAVTPADIIRPTKIEPLHELDADVQPIDFKAMVRDLRDYPKEFKDKRYLIANKGKWTVQVMNVAENDVIVDYLLGREDRSKFAYFRYRDDNDQLRYMLTYGVMSSPQEAIGASQLIDFGLPANVRLIPEEFNRYVSIIDNYELADPVVDLAANSNREVKLRPTRREVPVRRQSSTQNNAAATDRASTGNTSTTTNRSDSSGDSTQSAATGETTNNGSQKRAQSSIKASDDNRDTLVVQEERRVDSGEKTDTNAGANDNKASDTNKNEIKKPANTSESGANTDGAAAKPAKEKTTAPASGNTDPIKNLIEEKSN